MDKYDYVIEKPDIEEVLYHAGFHKYIERWRGKNGKWYYRYKSKAQETGAKTLRTIASKLDTTITNDIRKNKSILIPSNVEEIRDRRGYSTSRSGQTGSKLKAGLIAGRKRAAAQRSSSVKEAQNKRPRSRKKRYTTGTARVYKHK